MASAFNGRILVNGEPLKPVVFQTFELATAMMVDAPGKTLFLDVKVSGFGNEFRWPLVPLDYPDLNPKTYKRTVRG